MRGKMTGAGDGQDNARQSHCSLLRKSEFFPQFVTVRRTMMQWNSQQPFSQC